MRTMFILRGCPGSGKSRLVAKLGLAELAIGFDRFRELFSAPFPCAEADGSVGMTRRLKNSDQAAVVTATFAALTTRLQAGTTVVFDATSLKVSDQQRLADLGSVHGYRSIVVDVQNGLEWSQCLIRNGQRPSVERLDPERLRQMWELGADETAIAPGLQMITPSQLPAALAECSAVPQVSAERIVVVGDVHSCSEPLNTAISELDAPGTQWVFSGDLFDRGPDPVGVWRTVRSLLDQGRAHVVTGNHERNLRTVNNPSAPAALRQTTITRDLLLAAGIDAQAQIDFVDSTSPALLISTGGEEDPWLVTHGGVDSITAERIKDQGLLHVADATCIYGLGLRSDTYSGRSTYRMDELRLAPRQLHGHRDGSTFDGQVSPVPAVDDDLVICLEAGASVGGSMRVAVLESNSIPVVHDYDDGLDPALSALSSPLAEPLLDRMRSSPLVTIRPVEGFDGIVSANFTRQAFRDGAWTDLTIHARGLFFDEATGEIVARGYEKFFHPGEGPGRTLAAWANAAATQYPVTAIKKYNGFLALVSCVQGRLAVFTKAGVTNYSRFAEAMLADRIGHDRVQDLASMLERTGTTAVFEVITASDPHPINEPVSEDLVLLDVIMNQQEFSTNDKLALGISRRFGIEQAQIEWVANNPREFDLLLASVADRSDEGVVIRDASGYRGKIKAREYATRKAARGALTRVVSGKATTLGPRHQELESRLVSTGLWHRLPEFLVVSLNGSAELDLAGLFDELSFLEAGNAD